MSLYGGGDRTPHRPKGEEVLIQAARGSLVPNREIIDRKGQKRKQKFQPRKEEQFLLYLFKLKERRRWCGVKGTPRGTGKQRWWISVPRGKRKKHTIGRS